MSARIHPTAKGESRNLGRRNGGLGIPAVVSVCLVAACSPAVQATIEPVVIADTSALEPDVLELVLKHVGIVRQDPASAGAHGKLGLVYEANELWDPAAASYANAAILDPREPLWRYHRSITLRQAGRTAEANQLLIQSASELPKAPGVQHRLGHVLLDLGDLDGADAAFGRALALAPEQPECLVGMALVRLAREDWATARDLGLRAVRRDPEYKQAHYVLGLSYRGLGDVKTAASALTLGADAKTRFLDDPLSTQLRGFQVNLMSQIGEAARLAIAHRPEEAVALWARIVARHPGDKYLLTNYGAALLGMGRVEEAIEVLNRSLALDEREFTTHMNLAEAYLDARKTDQALEHAARAVELGPQIARAHRIRARVLAGSKSFEEAYSELHRAVELDPRDAVTCNALSEMSILTGRREEGKSWCQAALDLDPSSLPARVNLARLTLSSGDAEAARVQVKELLRIAPDNPRVQALAAEVGLPRR